MLTGYGAVRAGALTAQEDYEDNLLQILNLQEV